MEKINGAMQIAAAAKTHPIRQPKPIDKNLLQEAENFIESFLHRVNEIYSLELSGRKSEALERVLQERDSLGKEPDPKYFSKVYESEILQDYEYIRRDGEYYNYKSKKTAASYLTAKWSYTDGKGRFYYTVKHEEFKKAFNSAKSVALIGHNGKFYTMVKNPFDEEDVERILNFAFERGGLGDYEPDNPNPRKVRKGSVNVNAFTNGPEIWKEEICRDNALRVGKEFFRELFSKKGLVGKAFVYNALMVVRGESDWEFNIARSTDFKTAARNMAKAILEETSKNMPCLYFKYCRRAKYARSKTCLTYYNADGARKKIARKQEQLKKFKEEVLDAKKRGIDYNKYLLKQSGEVVKNFIIELCNDKTFIKAIKEYYESSMAKKSYSTPFPAAQFLLDYYTDEIMERIERKFLRYVKQQPDSAGKSFLRDLLLMDKKFPNFGFESNRKLNVRETIIINITRGFIRTIFKNIKSFFNKRVFFARSLKGIKKVSPKSVIESREIRNLPRDLQYTAMQMSRKYYDLYCAKYPDTASEGALPAMEKLRKGKARVAGRPAKSEKTMKRAKPPEAKKSVKFETPKRLRRFFPW